MAASRPRLTTLILWAIVWAAALITSAVLLKGNPIKDWFQSALFVAGNDVLGVAIATRS
jgi:hypothetical protein